MTDLLEIALREYGNKEITGNDHNLQVVKYFTETGDTPIRDDETPWCSAFVNWCAMMGGYVRTKKLNARSWLEVGSNVDEKPLLGDIVIFWREKEDSWKGHVGIFINKVGDDIYTIGGNQSNQVSIAPYNASRLLGFRRLYKIN
ncbi:MAG: TIGR02594 family protein [Bacteroidota bacterium]